jgi:hypothetical protein
VFLARNKRDGKDYALKVIETREERVYDMSIEEA